MMGTWGIARDMAKRNEENLKKLSSRSRWSQKSIYRGYLETGSKAEKKAFSFKKSTPEFLTEIKEKRSIERKRAAKKQALLFLLSVPIAIGSLYLIVGLLRYVFFS